MNISLGRLILLVKDYEEAFDFYSRVLNCHKIFDKTAENGQRFLHIGFGDTSDTGLWLLKAESDEQLRRVGNQTGGQPLLVLYTDHFEKSLEQLKREKVTIHKQPEEQDDFKFLHFLDLYGNEIVLVEMK